jgi:hypothetical protein
LRHGQGCDIFVNGDKYLGEYSFGSASGYGQYRWSNGNIYSGIFRDGMKHGKGIWKKDEREEVANTY